MKKRMFIVLLSILVGLTIMLTACGKNGGNNQENASSSPGNETSGNTDIPENDVNSEKYTINFIQTAWFNTPITNDPWKPWADKKYNVDFRMTTIPYGDLGQKLLVAFASQEQPDLIFTSDKTLIEKLYNQGVLLDDYTPYLDKLPTMTRYFNDGTMPYTSRNGKMIMLPLAPGPSNFAPQIRNDWLTNLGMKMPTTEEELFEYLKAATFNDPDQNGKNDTYGTTAAGTGANLNIFAFFELMYGPSGFYIGGDGTVSNSIIDGTHEKMLNFVKRLVDAKVVDPDWYLQDWEKMKTKLHSDKIGMIWYPPGITNEAAANKTDENYLNYWEPFAIPKETPQGGKLFPDPIANGMYVISAKAAEDPGKLNRILHILDDVQYPNEGYLGFRWGVGVPGVDQEIRKTEDGKTYINLSEDLRSQPENRVAYDYGTWVNFDGTDPILQIFEPTPGKLALKVADANEKIMGFEKQEINYMGLLNLDTTIVTTVGKLQDQFDIQYILGKETDYGKFKDTWLKSGGQELLNAATEQFRTLGLIK